MFFMLNAIQKEFYKHTKHLMKIFLFIKYWPAVNDHHLYESGQHSCIMEFMYLFTHILHIQYYLDSVWLH